MERKEAIEIVRNNFPNERIQLIEALEMLIPELRESDDEKIRKWIIDDIRDNMYEEPLNNTEYKRKGEKAIAWLERIGEGIPSKETVLNVWDLGNIWKELTNGASNTEHGTQLEYVIKHWKEGEHYVKQDEREADGWKEGDVIKYGDSSIVRALVIKGRMAVKSNGEVFTVQYPDEWVKVSPDEKEKFLDKLESQCGRLKWKEERGKKPADNVEPKFEPKFKVGDWIVANDGINTNNGTNTFLITNINCDHCSSGDVGIISIYCALEDTEGVTHYPCLLSKNFFHPWTIEDAEDGDVLVDEDNNIGIYRERDDLNWSSYIYLGCDNRLRGFSIGGYHTHKNTRPATKEQRDLLFSKMKDAGYEWVKQEAKDNVKPKFKAEDWIVCDGIDSAAKITGIDADSYEAEFFDGSTRFSDIGFVDRNFRPWTVEDAKDGDVLVNHNDEVPFIFKGFLDKGHPNYPVAYCGINDGGKFKICSGDYFWEDGNVKPATKEQREFLFSKMREAGYEWDAVSKSFRQLL